MQMQSLNNFEQECPTTKNKGQNKEPSWLNRLNEEFFRRRCGCTNRAFFFLVFSLLSSETKRSHSYTVRGQCLLQTTEIDNAVWSVLEL